MREVEEIIARLHDFHIHRYSLLVVPGRQWESNQIHHLDKWFSEGAEPVAHGWLHETTPSKFFHRIHSAFLSRKVAEHLDLDGPGILDLMARSKDWFVQHELPEPETYVPPAWALGRLTPVEIEAIPFRCVEVTRGILFPHASRPRRLLPLPLCGFEADTPLRQTFLRVWNHLQYRKAEKKDLPIRISIHPNDFELRCHEQLSELLSLDLEPILFADMNPNRNS
jgi:hypothetical protein